MEKLKNKNTIILILSAVLIMAAVVIALTAISSSKKSFEKPNAQASSTTSQPLDLEALASKNSTTQPAVQAATIGKYKVSGNDPLNLRMGPDVKTDIITYVEGGTEVNIIAVWEDWGYVIYEKTGGWLSMNYLEPVGASAKLSETETKKSN